MPYIPKEQRRQIDTAIKELVDKMSSLPKSDRAGVLNYTVSSMIDSLYHLKYSEVNEAIGALECIKQEYYRRIASPYEDIKISENGDVFNTKR